LATTIIGDVHFPPNSIASPGRVSSSDRGSDHGEEEGMSFQMLNLHTRAARSGLGRTPPEGWMRKVPRIATPQTQRVEKSLTYFLNALHLRALRGNSVVGNSQDHDNGFVPTFSQAQSAALRFPLYLEFFLLRQTSRTLPLAFHSPVLGSVNQSIKQQGAKAPRPQDSPSSGANRSTISRSTWPSKPAKSNDDILSTFYCNTMTLTTSS
jgi:hypothetical protein